MLSSESLGLLRVEFVARKFTPLNGSNNNNNSRKQFGLRLRMVAVMYRLAKMLTTRPGAGASGPALQSRHLNLLPIPLPVKSTVEHRDNLVCFHLGAMRARVQGKFTPRRNEKRNLTTYPLYASVELLSL